jgi:hypothetical protein
MKLVQSKIQTSRERVGKRRDPDPQFERETRDPSRFIQQTSFKAVQ